MPKQVEKQTVLGTLLLIAALPFGAALVTVVFVLFMLLQRLWFMIVWPLGVLFTVSRVVLGGAKR